MTHALHRLLRLFNAHIHCQIYAHTYALAEAQYIFCHMCSVVIRGQPSDEAVMCTERRTYELKLVETSNTLLLAPSLQTPKDPGECVWKGMGGCGEWMWVWCGECVMCEWVWCVGVCGVCVGAGVV